jgi:hypothetical protein
LSRGLVLVKWWLLAIPHYLVIGFFVGSTGYIAGRAGEEGTQLYTSSGGLVGLLVFFAAVLLLFTAGYPRGIFDFVLGMDRWTLRVIAYATLMTDEYPPFRMDLGGDDPAAITTTPPPPDAAFGQPA